MLIGLHHLISVLLGEDCVSRKHLVPYLYFPGKKVGSVQLVVSAELDEDLGGFGCVPPGIVSFYLVLALQATEGSVFAVEAILQVNLGLPDEVVCSDHVMVIDQDGEQGLLWERGLDLK